MKKTLLELFFLIIFSSIVIFFQFNEVPKKLSWDEVEFSRLALSLDKKPYTPYSQLATGHSTLYFYVILLSFKLFGLTNFALRFPAALFGVINVTIFYFIASLVFLETKYFNKHFLSQKIPLLNVSIVSLIPFLLSLIFVTSRWYFNFARFSFEVTFLLFLELTSIYFFLKFVTRSRVIAEYDTLFLIIAGLFAGLTFLSYYPGRIFFLLPLLFLIVYSSKKLIKKHLLIFLIVFFIAASPLIVYLATHKDQRIQEQLFLSDNKLSLQSKITYIGINIAKLAFTFNLYGDLNGRHNYPGKPILNPLIGAFFLFGFLVTVLNLKNFYNQFFLVYFILSMLPAVFTYPAENPNSLRTFTAVIPALYFVGSGILYLLQSEKKSRILTLAVMIVLTLLFILSSAYDLRTYFLYQKAVFSKSFELNGSIVRILNLKLWEKSQFF